MYAYNIMMSFAIVTNTHFCLNHMYGKNDFQQDSKKVNKIKNKQ